MINLSIKEQMMRKMFFQPIILALCLMALLLTLAACGGSSPEPTATPVPPTATPEPVAAVVGDPAVGAKVYQTTCVACHGPDAKGVQGLGKTLHPSESEFVTTKTDEEMVEYIKVGRRIDDPLNTTGIDMPPKGGNPAMTEEDMFNVVAFIRTLQ